MNSSPSPSYLHLLTQSTGKIEMEAAKVVVERVDGRSRVTRCLSKYPLKFIIPSKVCSSEIDAIWIYIATYGGGIVSGDTTSSEIVVGDGATAVLTTQASTKVYKSLEHKCSEQLLEAKVGDGSLLVVIPDPVTCFSTARYIQKQVFHVASESNLVVVDWITSGRHESGEKWDFELYKSSNSIYNEGQRLFLDSVLLEESKISSLVERMNDYQVVGMLILLGPKLKQLRTQVQDNVREMMSGQLRMPFISARGQQRPNSDKESTKPSFVVSASTFGPKGSGLVVRIAAVSTESVYKFLHQQLSGLESLVGVAPYRHG